MNNCQYTLIALLVILLWPASGNGESFDSKVRDGVSNYEKQQYEKASQLFQDAYARQPENGQLAYNLANSDYKSGKFDKALESYAKAMTSDAKLKQEALYNSGNALYRAGKLEEAEAAYKKSLELNSKDLDAKYNLEFVREDIKKQKQQQKQENQNPDKQQNQDKQNQDSNQQPKKSDQDNNQQESKDKKKEKPSEVNQQAQSKPSDIKNEQSSQSDLKKAEMTKEEADQWLRSLVENPKKFAQKQIQDQLKQSKAPVGNDW